MKKLTLLKLVILNFKGIRELTIEFDKYGRVVNVYGDNGTGKTTIVDAWLWLVTGKNSNDEKNFQIKTLDSNNEAYHKMSHEVSALIDVDGDQVTLRHTYTEDWTTKKGTATEQFTGHTHGYYWNDVPMQLKEYQVEIDKIINEEVFKLLCNTNYFCTRPWQYKRGILLDIAGEITSTMIFKSLELKGILTPQNDFSALISALNVKKTVEQYKKEIVAKKNLVIKEKDGIKPRIEELTRNLGADEIDYDANDRLLVSATGELEQVDAKINDKNVALQQRQQQVNNWLQEQQTLKLSVQGIEFKEKQEVQNRKSLRAQELQVMKNGLQEFQNSMQTLTQKISAGKTKLEGLQQQKEQLGTKWDTEDATELKFNDSEFNCPTCHRALEATDIEAKKVQLTNNFNQKKSQNLATINEEGKAVKQQIEELQTKLTQADTDWLTLKTGADNLEPLITTKEQENAQLDSDDDNQLLLALGNNTEYQSSKQQIEELQAKITEPQQPDEDKAALLTQKTELTTKIQNYNRIAGGKEARKRTTDRINELKEQEQSMAQELATLEGIEFSIMQYEQEKMATLEDRVNSMFKIVKFKMYEKNINEGQQDTCIPLIDGVPYSDANTASKINAGLDIINVLSQHYNISAPIFIDNRESVVQIQPTDSQVVNLWVTEGALLSVGEIKYDPLFVSNPDEYRKRQAAAKR